MPHYDCTNDLHVHEKSKAYSLDYFREWKFSSTEWKRKPAYLQNLCYFGGKFSHRKRWHLVGLQTRVAKRRKFDHKARKVFATRRKAVAKFQTLSLQRCFIYVFLIWPEDPFKQEVSGVYTFLFLDTDGLKMALRARKVSGAFEKQTSGFVWALILIGQKTARSRMFSNFNQL